MYIAAVVDRLVDGQDGELWSRSDFIMSTNFNSLCDFVTEITIQSA